MTSQDKKRRHFPNKSRQAEEIALFLTKKFYKMREKAYRDEKSRTKRYQNFLRTQSHAIFGSRKCFSLEPTCTSL